MIKYKQVSVVKEVIELNPAMALGTVAAGVSAFAMSTVNAAASVAAEAPPEEHGLTEELTGKVAEYQWFTIGDVIPKGILPLSTVVTWGIMIVMVILAIILTRNLTVTNVSKKQAMLEAFIGVLHNLFYSNVGERGKRYIQYLLTVLLFLGIANMTGLIGIAPPTKDINVPIALALMSILLVQYAGIRQKGVGGWLKAFTQPVSIVTPLNILELGIKPLSLCMRLFGNVLGAYIIMELIIFVVPAVIPMVFSLYFDIFDGLLQAYVFCFLTSLYINEAVEEEE